jgi:N-acylneuraminate cytidylyltransferase
VAVVLWALEQETADLVVMLQPTSPFRTYRQIDAAIELYNSKPVVSMKKLHGRIYESGRTADLMCQQYTGWLKSNGAIYVDAPDALRARGQFHASSVTPYIMDSLTSLEIDEELDWLLAVSIVEKAADAMEAVLESARKGCGQCAQKKMDG